MSVKLTPEESARLKQAMEAQWARPSLRNVKKKAKWGRVDWNGEITKPKWLRYGDRVVDLRDTQ